jgi:hypothetical protein
VGKFIPVEPEKWAEMVKAQAENARLKAEVERLTKAGDNMERAIQANGCDDNGDWDDNEDAMKQWNDAKKGGRP